MAKDKFMEGRNEGMAFALQIAEENGIEGLRKEVRFRGITKLPTAVPKKALDEFTNNVKMQMVDTFKILLAATLRDEFGFGREQIWRALNNFSNKAECLADDYCTWEDYIETLNEELGLEFVLRRNDKDVNY